MGPSKQFKNMTTGGRWAASLVYIGAIIATLAIAFTVKGIPGGILVIVFLVLQFMAALWWAFAPRPRSAAPISLSRGRGGPPPPPPPPRLPPLLPPANRCRSRTARMRPARQAGRSGLAPRPRQRLGRSPTRVAPASQTARNQNAR
jgi:hypothetical protein